MINNAAQTVRKPPAAYTSLIAEEKEDLNEETQQIVLASKKAIDVPSAGALVLSAQTNSPLQNLGDLSKVSPSALLSMVPFLE